MVREVTAYAAEDGRVFPTAFEASKHDAEQAITRLQQFKPETITAILNLAPELVEALNFFAAETLRQRAKAEPGEDHA